MYRIRTPDNYKSHDLGSLIIYEGTGALLDLITDIDSAISTIEDTEKEETLKEVRDALNTIKTESWTSVLNPLKMWESYQALVWLRE
jgi:hypothetical protein